MNDDRDLAALLADPPHVDDDGFTDRVVTALPPRRRASRLVYALVPASAAAAFAILAAADPRALTSAPLLLALATAAVAASLAGTADA